MSLPPLQSITALETLDRLGSVKATSAALGLTQSAISHKLKTLQSHLGFDLTTAYGRGLVLTPQARQYVHSIRPALQALQDAHQTVSTATGPLTISCVPGFAAYWLAPRLSEFRHLFPEISLRLHTRRETSAEILADIAIDFTAQIPAGITPLMQAHFFPVCAPTFAHAHPLPKRAADLDPAHFLHLDTRADWQTWLQTQSAPQNPANTGVVFDDVQTMLAAAQSGQGICLGDRLTCDAAIKTGALIRPYAAEILSDKAYVLTVKSGATAAAKAFETWLKTKIADG